MSVIVEIGRQDAPAPASVGRPPAPTARPRRVLMTADPVGGVWSFALELIRELGDGGVDVALATMGAPLRREQRGEAARLGNVELFESRFRLEWMEDPWDDVRRAGEWLLGIEDRVKPDVVHLNGYVHAALGWRAPVLVVAHSCALSWWRAVRGETAPLAWERYRCEVAAGLRAASAVVAPTRAMLTSLRRYYGPVWGARVIPNGREPRPLAPTPKQALILSAGRFWDPARNLGTLDAVALDLPWPVCLAGDDGHAPPGAPRPANLCTLGRLSASELQAWMQCASIFALPARYEPFGLAVLEAALGSCALVLGDIPSLRENWEGAALFVPPGDAAALRDALQALIRLDERRRALADRARARGLDFTARRMAGGYMEVYGSLLSEPQRARAHAPGVPA